MDIKRSKFPQTVKASFTFPCHCFDNTHEVFAHDILPQAEHCHLNRRPCEHTAAFHLCVCARAWHRREREGEGRVRIASCADSHCLIQSSLYIQIFLSRTDYSLSFHTVFANFSPAPFCKWNVIKVREILTYFLLSQEL